MTDKQIEKIVIVIEKRKQITAAMSNIIKIIRKVVEIDG